MVRSNPAALALTRGTDLATVAELLGHKDLNTTRGYLHLVDTRRRDAVRRLAVTVPEDVLDGVGKEPRDAAALSSMKEAVPKVLESPATPEAQHLDDQYRLGDNLDPKEPVTDNPGPTKTTHALLDVGCVREGSRCLALVDARCWSPT